MCNFSNLMIQTFDLHLPLDSYICQDRDGLYCLPSKYKESLTSFLFGNRTEETTKFVIAEQYEEGDIFHAEVYVGDFLN